MVLLAAAALPTRPAPCRPLPLQGSQAGGSLGDTRSSGAERSKLCAAQTQALANLRNHPFFPGGDEESCNYATGHYDYG